MLSIAPGSSCDVCSEEYGPAKHPHSLLCGHVLCDECIRCVLASAGGVGRAPCPWCRAPFAANAVRKIHVDWPCSSSDSDEDDENEDNHDARRPVRVGLAPSAKDDLHAYCNLCDWTCSGERYKCLQCPDFDVCGTCFAGQASTRHPDHGFVRLTSARDLFNAKSTAHRPAHAAECDHCGAGIRGVRYKCTHASCPDYDLCEDCEALPIPVHPLSHILAKIRVPVGAFALDSPPLPSKPPHLFTPAAAAHYHNHNHLPSDPVVLPQGVLDYSAAFGRIPAGADNANAGAEVDEDMGLSADCVVCDACQSMIHGVRFKCMHETCPDYDLCAECESQERHGVGHPVDHPMLRTVMHSSLSLSSGSGFASLSDVAVPSYGVGATASDTFRPPTMVVPRVSGGAELEARMGMVL